MTPVFISAQKGHTDCLQHLIEARADANEARNSGDTLRLRERDAVRLDSSYYVLGTGKFFATNWARTISDIKHNLFMPWVHMFGDIPCLFGFHEKMKMAQMSSTVPGALFWE